MTPAKDYTTQASLSTALHDIFRDTWQGDEITVPGSRRRWDMAYSEGGGIVVVEYDGDEHYRHSLKIRADHEKDRAAANAGYTVVRFPYWLQLESRTLLHFFGLSVTMGTDFPHGFITTKHFPASFCELGIRRFQSELDTLPRDVRAEVVGSLEDRVEQFGLEYVLPSSLFHLVAA